jgi:nicotinamide-nucleotide amidase
MPSLELIAIGTELLLGDLTDTNSAYIAAAFARTGIDVRAMHAVGDNRERIAALLREILDRADGAVTTGGLGPTVDDCTREAVSDVMGAPLELHEPSLRAIEAVFARLGFPMRDNNRRQALIPRGALVLDNPWGTAPGFVAAREDGRFVACLPGVPHEMRRMVSERLVPLLRERLGVRATIRARVLHCIGLAESEIDHRIADLFATSENPKIAVLAHQGVIDVRITAKAADAHSAEALIRPLQHEIERRLHGHVFGYDDTSLAAAVLESLQARGLRLAVAESCTGGRVCSEITAVPGASASFAGGIVAYENSVKMQVLGVDGEKLERHGAVSEEVAIAMAQGAYRALNADLAVAVTGIAGPSGGTPEKPVGTVWIAVAATAGATHARRLEIPGDRDAVQRRATFAALAALWRYLRPGPE